MGIHLCFCCAFTPLPLMLLLMLLLMLSLPSARRYPEYSVTGVASKELENVTASTDLPHDEDEA